jgi:hypothetical protein
MVVTQELGNTIQTEKELEDLVKNQLQKDETEPVAKCGNCYGAGAPGECCNSCDDVKAAYTRYGWKFNPQGIAQCRREALKDTIESERATDGGCRLYGLLDLDKAAGHFHIAPHKQAHKEKAEANPILTLLDFINYTFDQFNITHTVNSLEFGHQFPGIKSPLDSQLRTLQDTHAMYQYYMKIVPTRYKNSKSGREIESNQYSVTEHMRHLAPGSGRGVPGVYFNYELAPIQAIYEEKQPINFSSFLTSVCAIVGGVFTVLGLLDKFIIDVANIFSAGLL